MRLYVVLLLLFAAAACAPTTEWARNDTSLEQRQKDETECHDIASWQALDESDKTRPIYPPFRDTQFMESGGEDGSAEGMDTSWVHGGGFRSGSDQRPP